MKKGERCPRVHVRFRRGAEKRWRWRWNPTLHPQTSCFADVIVCFQQTYPQPKQGPSLDPHPWNPLPYVPDPPPSASCTI